MHVELGSRVQHQKIDVDAKQKDYSDTGVSASAAANWQFAPNYHTISLTGLHQQRFYRWRKSFMPMESTLQPTPMSVAMQI